MQALKGFLKRRAPLVYQMLTLVRNSILSLLLLCAHSDKFASYFYGARRNYLSKRIVANSTENIGLATQDASPGVKILKGPFAGLIYQIHSDSWFDHPQSIVQKINGVYEQEVLEKIVSRKFELLIDIGAGTGYYTLGLLRTMICKSALMYESMEELHSTIQTGAEVNEISPDRYTIKGAASQDELLSDLKEYLPKTRGSVVIICDVEGFECQLFSQPIIEYLAGFDVTLFIEIHRGQFFKYSPKFDFLQAIEEYFETHTLKTMSRDVSALVDYALLIDDKWLLASENRTNGSQIMVCKSQEPTSLI